MSAVSGRGSDRGSASLWVLTAGLVVLTIALGFVVRTTAVMARHRVERSADLAALAAAAGIGIDPSSDVMCGRADAVARANGARLADCRVTIDDDGRSGTVSVRVEVAIRLAGVGARSVSAGARAARLPG